MLLLPCGPDAVLVEVDSDDEVAAVRAAVLAAELPFVVDVVPAARTVLVRWEPGYGARPALLRDLHLLGRPAADPLAGPSGGPHSDPPAGPSAGSGGGPHGGSPPGVVDRPAGRSVTIPVRYDGPDLELVAATAGITTDEVVALHTGAAYTVAFCGFAPGFGYLTGLPELLRQPRLDSPRPSVPAGSVGIAGPYTGVYPRSTPGGWRLLGSTTATLFDLADPARPALLAPGDRVRFEVAPC